MLNSNSFKGRHSCCSSDKAGNVEKKRRTKERKEIDVGNALALFPMTMQTLRKKKNETEHVIHVWSTALLLLVCSETMPPKQGFERKTPLAESV